MSEISDEELNGLFNGPTDEFSMTAAKIKAEPPVAPAASGTAPDAELAFDDSVLNDPAFWHGPSVAEQERLDKVRQGAAELEQAAGIKIEAERYRDNRQQFEGWTNSARVHEKYAYEKLAHGTLDEAHAAVKAATDGKPIEFDPEKFDVAKAGLSKLNELPTAAAPTGEVEFSFEFFDFEEEVEREIAEGRAVWERATAELEKHRTPLAEKFSAQDQASKTTQRKGRSM